MSVLKKKSADTSKGFIPIRNDEWSNISPQELQIVASNGRALSAVS